MKKFICTVLTLLIVFSMVACSAREAEPATTESTTAPIATTEAATEAITAQVGPEETMPEGFLYDVEGSLAENSTTVSFDTREEYETFLRDLGFVEVWLDSARVHMDPNDFEDLGDPACFPVGLTYNNDVFRLDFDYINEDEYQGIEVFEKGWVMYGTKNSIAPFNISPVNEQDFIFVDYTDTAEETVQFSPSKNYARVASYHFMNFDFDENLPEGVEEEVFPTDYQVLFAHYFPKTHNLYNITRDVGGGTYTCARPRILWESYEDEKSEIFGSYEWSEEEAELIINNNGVEEATSFLMHMTLIDWCFSQYNKTGWTYVDDTTICSPDGLIIENANEKIVNLAKKNENNQYVITLP